MTQVKNISGKKRMDLKLCKITHKKHLDGQKRPQKIGTFDSCQILPKQYWSQRILFIHSILLM